MIKKLISLISITAFIVTCAGCGGNERKENQLLVWHIGPESQAQTIMKLSEKFTEETGIEVICQAVSWGNAHSKYLTSIAGEVTPDIGTMGLTWGMEFGELGAMVDLREAFPDDVAAMEKNIFPGILRSTQVGEKVYGIPFDLSEYVLYYRTDIISSPPSTWEELIETIRRLESKDMGMVMDWGSLDWIGYSPFLWQAGGKYYNDDHTKATLNTPEAAEALNFFAKLYAEGVPKTQVPLEQGMRTGDYPMAISGNWKIISLTLSAPEIKGKWSIAMLPKGPTGKRTAFMGGRIAGIFSRSKMKREAWEFIKFLFQAENQIKIYQDSLETEEAYLPPNMETWKKLPMDKKFKRVLEDQARDAQGPPPVRGWDLSTRYVNHAIQMVVLKGADASAELEKANKAMQAELDKRKIRY